MAGADIGFLGSRHSGSRRSAGSPSLPLRPAPTVPLAPAAPAHITRVWHDQRATRERTHGRGQIISTTMRESIRTNVAFIWSVAEVLRSDQCTPPGPWPSHDRDFALTLGLDAVVRLRTFDVTDNELGTIRPGG